MATIKDIAKTTGYSISTVSKALNGYDDISEKAKAKIIKVAESMQYYPDYKSKNLKKRQSKNIALIINGIGEKSEGSSVTQDFIAGIYNYAAINTFDLIIYTTDQRRQSLTSYYEFCKTRNIDGAILLGISMNDPYFEELKASNLPIVTIDILLENTSKNVGAVTIDNVRAAFEATEYLIKMGHTHIAFLNGTQDAQVSQEREEGYKQAMKENGLKIVETRILYGDFRYDKAVNEGLKLLQIDRNVTAVFCASDIMAVGVYEACNKLELKIPEDISVLGFDGIPLSQYVSPKLSTVAQDMYAMGKYAAEMLREIIYENKKGRQEYFEYTLAIRESVSKHDENISKI